MTVGLWHNTSKRFSTMNSEMSKQSVMQNYTPTNKLLAAIASDTINEYVIKYGPFVAPESVKISEVLNMKSFFISDVGGIDFKCVDEDYRIEDLLKGTSLDIYQFNGFVNEGMSIEEKEFMHRAYSRTKLSIVQGISIIGNKESRLGKVYLYATNNFNNKNVCRYDFVNTNQGDSNQLAQVLVFLKYSNQNNSQSKFFAIVRYLNYEPYDLKSRLPIPFQVYTWEILKTRKFLQKFSLQMIDVASIINPEFVHSYLEEISIEPLCSRPLSTDKFWHIPRRYCDRADYDTLYKDKTDIHADVPGVPEINNFVNDADSCIDDNSESSDDLFDSDEEYYAVTNTHRVVQTTLEASTITNLNDLEKENDLHPLSEQLKKTLFRKYQGNNWVEVRRSLLLGNSGWGLFAKRNIPDGFAFCTYEGTFPNDEDLYSKDIIYNSAYVASIGIPSSKKTPNGPYTQFYNVDAVDEMSCYARFINDPIDESYVNSKLVWDERLDVGVAISAGSIDKGEEIYQHYSDSYWTSNGNEELLHPSLRALLRK